MLRRNLLVGFAQLGQRRVALAESGFGNGALLFSFGGALFELSTARLKLRHLSTQLRLHSGLLLLLFKDFGLDPLTALAIKQPTNNGANAKNKESGYAAH